MLVVPTGKAGNLHTPAISVEGLTLQLLVFSGAE